jgi:hypothetical protein
MHRPCVRTFVLFAALALPACRGSMVQEYAVPAPSAGGGSAGTNVVRTTAHGPVWALGCLARNHTFSQSATALGGQATSQQLALLEAAMHTQKTAAQSAGQELFAIVGSAGSAGLTPDQRLRALNVVGAGLGAPRPFRDVAEAQAFFALASSGGAR